MKEILVSREKEKHVNESVSILRATSYPIIQTGVCETDRRPTLVKYFKIVADLRLIF